MSRLHAPQANPGTHESDRLQALEPSSTYFSLPTVVKARLCVPLHAFRLLPEDFSERSWHSRDTAKKPASATPQIPSSTREFALLHGSWGAVVSFTPISPQILTSLIHETYVARCTRVGTRCFSGGGQTGQKDPSIPSTTPFLCLLRSFGSDPEGLLCFLRSQIVQFVRICVLYGLHLE